MSDCNTANLSALKCKKSDMPSKASQQEKLISTLRDASTIK